MTAVGQLTAGARATAALLRAVAPTEVERPGSVPKAAGVRG
jgi:hypothetical protein